MPLWIGGASKREYTGCIDNYRQSMRNNGMEVVIALVGMLTVISVIGTGTVAGLGMETLYRPSMMVSSSRMISLHLGRYRITHAMAQMHTSIAKADTSTTTGQ